MAANKENMKVLERSKHKVRANKEDSSERNPLKTLSHHVNVENCLAGPSQGSSNTLDTRFVTYRHGYDELDWKFTVFKDNQTEPVSKKESKDLKENVKQQKKIEDEKPKKNSNRLSPTAAVLKSTPLIVISGVTPKVEINTTKKVKRSLKRPHARQQTTTSPVSAKSCQFSIFSNNDIKDRVPAPAENCFDQLNEAYYMDNLQYLLQTEKRVIGEPKIRKASRSCVINWIINVNGTNGNPSIVQLACWYLDCYLSASWVTINRLQVISAACFWIATKFHGRLISGKRLVKYSGYAFIEKELVAAERNILRKLHFQALPVAPHDYVPYLSWFCDQNGTGVVEAAAVFLCQCGLMIDKTLNEEYPSVVAAAAVKTTLVLLRLKGAMEKLKTCPIYKSAEKKAVNLKAICAQLRESVRVVSSVGYEYKAPLFKFSGPPHYIASKIVRAVNHKDILLLDVKDRQLKLSI